MKTLKSYAGQTREDALAVLALRPGDVGKLATNEPELAWLVYTGCPICREPFRPFMRGEVRRFGWFGLRKAVWSLICSACKEIVGHETMRRFL